MPGRRRITLDIAKEAERRGFSGIYVPSIFGNMAQCTALALATEEVRHRLVQEGAEPRPVTPEEHAALIDAEETKWSALIRSIGLKAE